MCLFYLIFPFKIKADYWNKCVPFLSASSAWSDNHSVDNLRWTLWKNIADAFHPPSCHLRSKEVPPQSELSIILHPAITVPVSSTSTLTYPPTPWRHRKHLQTKALPAHVKHHLQSVYSLSLVSMRPALSHCVGFRYLLAGRLVAWLASGLTGTGRCCQRSAKKTELREPQSLQLRQSLHASNVR